MDETLIEMKDIRMYFPVTSGTLFPHRISDIKAVDGVSLSIRRGETLGLVGESGSGKSTLGLCVLQLLRPTSGEVIYQGKDLCRARGRDIREVRRRLQMVFQDPYGSLNPRMTAAGIISEPLQIHRLMPRKDQRQRMEELLALVGLSPDRADRYPHEFSAGERQRVGIARALAVDPDFIVCDEPVSSLDVCVQAQVLSLLADLQQKLGLTYLFIAHDLAVVAQLSNRIAVMYRGRIVELGTGDQIVSRPIHPYTRALISAIPVPDPAVEKTRRRLALPGGESTTSGGAEVCSFKPNCLEADKTCLATPPFLHEVEPEHWVACWKT